MRVTILLLTSVLAGGCRPGDSGDLPDAGAPDAGEPLPECVPDQLRPEKQVDLFGEVIDFAVFEPVAGAEVGFTTAWDTSSLVPADQCPLVASFVTSDSGVFAADDLEVGSLLDPPIVYLAVSGADRAPTSSDQTLSVCASDCGSFSPTIRVPSAALAGAWRAALADGGVSAADTRGLVILEFREKDGFPTAGVVPTLGETDLEPGSQVRFLEADRMTVAPAGATATTASGLALIAVDAPDGTLRVGGRRGADERWADIGVLVTPGWIFLEDRERTVP